MGGGSGGGSGIAWVGVGKGRVGSYFARERAKQKSFEAVEGIMTESGIPFPPRPMSQEKVFGIGFLCGLLLGLFIGLIFWELT